MEQSQACKFGTICNVLYSNKDNFCSFPEEGKSGCSVITDIRNGALPEFATSLMKRKVDGSVSNLRRGITVNAVCPRSIDSKVKLKTKCILRTCPYYSENVSMHCMKLHTDAFIHKSDGIPLNVLEVGYSKTKTNINKMLEVGIYLSRMMLLLIRYKSDFVAKNDFDRKMKILHFENEPIYICMACHKADYYYGESTVCDCKGNRELRNKRRVLENTWRLKLEISLRRHKHNLSSSHYNGHLKDLSFIRGLLCNLKLENNDRIALNHIPFGYLFVMYHRLFKDSKARYAESFGMSNPMYRKAVRLYATDLIN